MCQQGVSLSVALCERGGENLLSLKAGSLPPLLLNEIEGEEGERLNQAVIENRKWTADPLIQSLFRK